MQADILGYFLVASSVFYVLALLVLTIKNTLMKTAGYGQDLSVLGTVLFSAYASIHILVPVDRLLAWYGLLVFGSLFIAIILIQRLAKSYHVAGVSFYVAHIFLTIAGTAWGVWFVSTIELSLVTKILMAVTYPLLFITFPFGTLQLLERYDVLCKQTWSRSRQHPAAPLPSKQPMVSIHVPVYAEPPEMVMETLDAIANLDYDNYEVLVIDNNTKDESLWRPVEAYCKQLGKKFRFFHLEPWPGAKAGALNFAITQTNPKAELVSIIDSDYQPRKTFLRDLVGHFSDPTLGFVQTPHDYRNWQDVGYLRMCYWEYKAFFHTVLVSLNERRSAITIGTMCILRKQALQDAGGWATWCMTEDSELAIRIHDQGYSSLYIEKSYGQGLIPETFHDFAKQRYRWTAGPVQELKHHAPHLMGLSKQSSEFSLWQRINHFNHGLAVTMLAFNFPLLGMSIAVATSMLVHQEIVPVPFALWLSITTLLCTNFWMRWLQYSVILKASFKDMIMSLLASKALTYVISLAAIRTLLNSQQRWLRTNKFKQSRNLLFALWATKTELSVSLALLVFAAVSFQLLPYPGMLAMILLGLGYKALDFLASPVVSIISALSLSSSKSATAPALQLALDA